MHTRSRGPSSPPSTETKQSAKRRATLTTIAAVKTEQPSIFVTAPDRISQEEPEHGGVITLTPRKANKRVRFSDPGAVRIEPLLDASTGLTPSFKRTRLSPGTHRIDKKRCTTLPPRLNLTSPPMTRTDKVQFTPLRQVLDSRMRRRLRRSHLSEEINSIEQEKRDEEKAQKELAQLRAQGHDSEERIRDLTFELESQRQLGIAINAEEETVRKAMTDELERLKNDLRASRPAEVVPPMSPAPTVRLPVDAPTEVDSDEDLWDGIGDEENSSPTMPNFSSSSPLTTPGSPIGYPSPARTRQLSVQALRQADADALRVSRDMSEQLETAAREASGAQTALRAVRVDLSRLGFADEQTSTPDAMITSIQDAFRRTRLELEHLLPGETTSGFENSLLLPAMVEHIRNLLSDLHESHRMTASVRQSETALRGQFNNTLAKLADVENRMTIVLAQRHEVVAETDRRDQAMKELEQAASAHAHIVQDRDSVIEGLEKSVRNMQQQLDGAGTHVSTLEAERNDHSTTIERLQTALQSYRDEVASVEFLVGNLDKERAKALEQSDLHRNNANELAVRNEELEAKNRNLETELKLTRQFLQDHVVKTKGNLISTMEEQEKAWQAVECFLRREVKQTPQDLVPA